MITMAKLKFRLFILLGLLQVGISRKVYHTCKDINDANTSSQTLEDGYYFILLQSGIAIQIYCANMRSGNPKEYIDLPAEEPAISANSNNTLVTGVGNIWLAGRILPARQFCAARRQLQKYTLSYSTVVVTVVAYLSSYHEKAIKALYELA